MEDLNIDEKTRKAFEKSFDILTKYFGWYNGENHMENSTIGSYKKLKDEEILKYKEMLKKPNIDFPYYEHLVVDNEIVYQYIGKNLTNEEFKINKYFMDNYNIKLEVSNYGRIKINDEYIIPTVDDNTFKHGLSIYINNDWNNKSIHRLVSVCL